MAELIAAGWLKNTKKSKKGTNPGERLKPRLIQIGVTATGSTEQGSVKHKTLPVYASDKKCTKPVSSPRTARTNRQNKIHLKTIYREYTGMCFYQKVHISDPVSCLYACARVCACVCVLRAWL